MRKNEIVVGQDYAHKVYGSYSRVRIVEVGVVRDVYNDWGRKRRSAVADGVRYNSVKRDGSLVMDRIRVGEYPNVELVDTSEVEVRITSTRNIAMTWDDYVAQQAKVQENKDARRNLIDANAARFDAAREQLESLGVSLTKYDLGGIVNSKVTMSLDELETVLRAVR